MFRSTSRDPNGGLPASRYFFASSRIAGARCTRPWRGSGVRGRGEVLMPPWAIDLGPLKLEAPRAYGPDDRGQAAVDAVLHCLYGKPWVTAERLITDITSKGIFG